MSKIPFYKPVYAFQEPFAQNFFHNPRDRGIILRLFIKNPLWEPIKNLFTNITSYTPVATANYSSGNFFCSTMFDFLVEVSLGYLNLELELFLSMTFGVYPDVNPLSLTGDY